MASPRLYADLASWWPLVSKPDEYADEAALVRTLLERGLPPAVGPRRLLELGCGGGNLACHLAGAFDLTLVDLSADMVEVASAQVPSARCLEGDMTSVRLGETFELVLIHDAIGYLRTEEQLAACFETVAAHLSPGGRAFFQPDHIAETFAPGTFVDAGDAPDGRSLRFMEWTWDPDPSDQTYQMDFAFLMRTPGEGVRCVHDTHTLGLFSEACWRRHLEAAGFEVDLEPLHRPEGGAAGVAWICTRR